MTLNVHLNQTATTFAEPSEKSSAGKTAEATILRFLGGDGFIKSMDCYFSPNGPYQRAQFPLKLACGSLQSPLLCPARETAPSVSIEFVSSRKSYVAIAKRLQP